MSVLRQVIEQNTARAEISCCSTGVPSWDHLSHPEAASHLSSNVLSIARMSAEAARAALQ